MKMKIRLILSAAAVFFACGLLQVPQFLNCRMLSYSFASSDPEQNPKRNSVIVGWDNRYYEIPLPVDVYCGKPVTVNLSDLKPVSKEEAAKKTAPVPFP